MGCKASGSLQETRSFTFEGLLKRGFTGVRQAGREVQTVSNRNYVSGEELERKSSLKKTMIASPGTSNMVITFLSRGLVVNFVIAVDK